MWFLLRSAFFFSLVWAALPSTGGAGLDGTAAATQQAVAGLKSLCAANPKQCLTTLSSLAEIDPSSIPPQLLTPPKPVKPVPNTTVPNITSPKPKAVSRPVSKKLGTLTAQDLQPGWRATAAKM